MSDKFKGYVIAFKNAPNKYLDHDGYTCNIHDAVIFHHKEGAEGCLRDSIHEDYLFEIKEICIDVK